MIDGTGRTSTFSGFGEQASVTGTKVMMNVGDDYGGLGSRSDSEGVGSIFRVLGAWFFIGAGSLFKNGVDTSADASTTLQIKKVTSGVLGTTYQAGLAQPSAPIISAVTAPAGYTGKNNGVVSVKTARVRAATGARSNASLSSNVVTATNQSIAITFPSADANGQDYWEVDVTKNGEGSLGNHFFLQEIPESVIAASTGSTVILDADTTINIPNGTLTSDHIGWTYRVGQTEAITAVVPANITTAGNARCVVTAVGLSGTPVTVTFAVALNDTDAQVADKARVALAANAAVDAFFNVGGEGAEIILTAKTIAANDATMNFTLEDVTSVGITDDTASTDVIAVNDTETYITGVGASDSGGAGYQQITLAAASAVTGNAFATFTRAVAGSTRTYVVEWRDADIAGSDLAPIRDYPPPAAIFGGVLGDVVFVDGALGDTVDVTQYAIDNSISRSNTTTTYRGNAIAVSDPARPESFPPDNYIFTNDPPTALMPGTYGIYWRFSRNSLGVVRYVGGSPAVTYERLWTGLGIENQKLCTLGAGGRLYAYTGGKGLVRLGINGEPDTAFAAPIHRDLVTSPATWLGYDADGQYVLVGTSDNIYAYHEPSDKWCAPISASGGISSVPEWIHSVTHNGACFISAEDPDTSTYKIYKFNEGGISVTSYPTLVTPWVKSEGSYDILSRMYIDIDAGASGGAASLGVAISCNAEAFFGYSGGIDITDNLQNVPCIRPNVSNARSWQVRLSHQTASFEQIVVEGETANIVF